jgi:hypothetical protein
MLGWEMGNQESGLAWVGTRQAAAIVRQAQVQEFQIERYQIIPTQDVLSERDWRHNTSLRDKPIDGFVSRMMAIEMVA